MARKAKKKMHKMPKLSFIDQLIYWTIMIFLLLIYFGSIFCHALLRKHIAFSDPMVMAVEDRASYLWVLIPWMVSFLITFIPWVTWYEDRKPIFGLRNFKYGPPAYPKIYPVFMKNKPYVWVSEKQKQNKRLMVVILLVVFLVSMIPFPMSLYGRECFLSDGTIEQYNMFNKKVKEYPVGQVASVNFELYMHSAGKRSFRKVWDVRVTLTSDEGKDYSFEPRDFRDGFDGDPCNWLTAMLQVKGRYVPEVVTYTGSDHLKDYVASRSWSETEIQMLYQLFNLSA